MGGGRPVIARLRLWLAAAGAVLSALAAIWLAGRKSARTDIKLQTAERDLEVMRRAEEVEDSVEGLTKEELRRRAKVWVRNN